GIFEREINDPFRRQTIVQAFQGHHLKESDQINDSSLLRLKFLLKYNLVLLPKRSYRQKFQIIGFYKNVQRGLLRCSQHYNNDPIDVETVLAEFLETRH